LTRLIELTVNNKLQSIQEVTENSSHSSVVDSVPLQQLYKLSQEHKARVICIGDAHGCVHEVCDLLRKVNYKPGDVVLFLGDLVAKGIY